MKYTPDNIDKLDVNQIFVFGSNAKGIHGKGAAKLAKDKFGAIYGQAKGLQGQSYAIITKKDWRIPKSSTPDEITQEFYEFLHFASDHPELEFLVTKIGSSLAGYSIEEMKNIIRKACDIYMEVGESPIPNNVILPKEFEFRYD